MRRFWNLRSNIDRFERAYRKDSSPLRRYLGRAVAMRQELALSLLDLYDRPAVLDVGCGSGRQSVSALRRGASRVTGIDSSGEMVAIARALAEDAAAGDRVEFIEADALSYDCDPERRYEVVWALGVFDYIRDPLPLLSRMARLSRGSVAASFRRRGAIRNPFRKIAYALRGCPIYFATRGRIEEVFGEAGLVEVEVIRTGPSGYFASGKVGK